MAIEVGDKPLTGDRISPVDTLHIKESEKNVADKVVKDIAHLTESGLSLEQGLTKVRQDFKLQETKVWPVEKTLFWQCVNEFGKEKINPMAQGYTLTMMDGEDIKIPHYCIAADVDVMEEFVQFIFKKGVKIGEDK